MLLSYFLLNAICELIEIISCAVSYCNKKYNIVYRYKFLLFGLHEKKKKAYECIKKLAILSQIHKLIQLRACFCTLFKKLKKKVITR